MNKLIYLFAIVILTFSLSAQDKTNTPFGKGLINTSAKDSSWSTKLCVRIQTRYEGMSDYDGANYEDKMYIRRSRIKASGYVFSPRVQYKIEYDMVNGAVLDAVIKWNFLNNWSLWFGQTKLPGNIERVISSQKLQFVDRSLLNSKFTLDRDAGAHLRHHFTIGQNFLVREIFAISQGEGLNQKESSTGFGYTARVELLPFGKFSSKGDYKASDLKREKTPKLMLAGSFDFNQNAQRSRGRKGDYISNPDDLRDITTLMFDAHFKYRGISFMGEFAKVTTDKNPNVTPLLDPTNSVIDGDYTYYTGTAYNLQAGYLLKKNWEIAGRYTCVMPEAATGNNDIKQYTLGLSKYIVGHNLKVQADVSIIEEMTKTDCLMFRLQTELAF